MLRQVDLNSTLRYIRINLLPNFKVDKCHKCEACVEEKLTKTPSHSIEINTKLLGLIHSDVTSL